MKAYSIKALGPFMAKLLSSPTFDPYLLIEAKIDMAAAFSIDGHLNRSFYDKNTWQDRELRPYDFAAWSDMRDYCRNIIKGKKAPSSFQFLLCVKPDFVPQILAAGGLSADIPELVRSLLLNIRLDETGLHVITGTDYKGFVPGKPADAVWDKSAAKFLSNNGIEFEEVS